jgi:hypothetical protein
VVNHSTTRVPHFIIAFPVSWFKVVISHIGMGGEVNPSMAQSLWIRSSNRSKLEQVWHAFQVYYHSCWRVLHVYPFLAVQFFFIWAIMAISLYSLTCQKVPDRLYHAVLWCNWKWRWQNSSKWISGTLSSMCEDFLSIALYIIKYI